MKKIYFIDDDAEMLAVQEAEMREILQDNPNVLVESIFLSMFSIEDCIDDAGRKKETTDARYQKVFSEMDSFISRLSADLNEYERTELVIDLCLEGGKNPRLGYRFAKFILSNNDNETAFNEQRLLITATTSIFSIDSSRYCRGIFSDEEKNRIISCYRPIFSVEKKNYFIDKGIQYFPIFYKQYHCEGAEIPEIINKLLLDTVNVPGQVGTAYGNYFGLVYARLYRNPEV